MKKRFLVFAAFALAAVLAFSFAGIQRGTLASDEETAQTKYEQKSLGNRLSAKESWPYGGEFGPAEIGSRVKGVSRFSSPGLEILDEEKAAAEGVPEGFSGNVITMSKGGSMGVTFDFSSEKIGVYALKSIAVKVFVESTEGDIKDGTDHYPEIRIAYPGVNDVWAVKYDVSAKTDRWVTIVLYADGKNFSKENKIYAGRENALMAFADGDGYLKAFEVAVRRKTGTGNFYIDSVAFNWLYDNGEAPVITYNGPEVMKIAKGSDFEADATAWDDGEKHFYPHEYAWEDGVTVDEDGMPPAGTKTKLKIRAYDGFGNGSEISVDAEICDPDVTPPVIKVRTDTVFCPVGAVAYPQAEVEDDYGVADVKYSWDKNTFDLLGKITEGEHKLTVTATDTSGNVSEKTVTFKAGDIQTAGLSVTDDEEAEPQKK